MQKSINRIDSESRKTNIIITGLPESDIVVTSNNNQPDTLVNDIDKVKVLIGNISEENDLDVDTWTIDRIGVPRDGSTRAIKVTTNNTDERDKVISLAPRLKSCENVWNKVYLKKDVHPVYAKETARIRRKRKELLTQYENNNENHEVKIVKGHLQVDGVTVDKNLFFV